MKNLETNPGLRTCVALAASLLGLTGALQAQSAKVERPMPAQTLVKTAAPVVVKAPAEERGDVPAPVAEQAKVTRAARAMPFDRSQAHWSTAADGTDWVRGTNYKAQFAADGMTMIPFLGSRAPVNHPTTMRLERATSGGAEIALTGVVEPRRDENRVVYERGLVDEVYDVEPGSIEQSFVVHGLPRSGSLELFIATETDLERRDGADGIEFTGERGGLHYSRAIVIDAAGRRAGAPTSVVPGGIEIDVPADFLATATFPVVVDPVMFAVVIDTDVDDDYRPDVAFDATTGRFMTVYEEAFSATDHDVRFVVTDVAGAFLDSGYVDGSTTNWSNPRVANNNHADQFMVVAQVGVAGSRVIQGRTFAAADMAFSATHTLSSSEVVDAVLPELGGDPSLAPPTYYCLVYESIYAPLDHDILANIVDNTCTVYGPTIAVDTSAATLDQHPSISPSNGVALDYNDQRWSIVWQRQYAPGDSDIYGAQLDWQGILVTPSFAVDNGTGNDFLPSVSTQLDVPGTARFAVAWQRRFATESDILIKVMEATATIAAANVGQLENAAWGKDQILPTIDSDGSQFVLAYSELYDSTGSDYDIHESVLYCSGNLIGLQDSHEIVTNTLAEEMRPEIVTIHGSGAYGSMYMVAYDLDFGTHHDVYGALSWTPVGVEPTEYCFGTDANCPCGNGGGPNNGCANSVNAAGAHLSAVGTGLVGSDTVTLLASGMPATATSLFFQGTGSTSSAFGDGRRCVNGAIVRLGLKTNAGGASSYPGVNDPSVSVRGSVPPVGGWRYYQCWYRNAAVFCTSSTFNLTNGVEVRWLP